MTTLFISDLHLDDSRPAVTEAFIRFLREQASCARALYILGDLFEVWVGDDDDSELVARCSAAMAELSERGVDCFIQHGNRDFLIGEDFCKATGFTLLEDPAVVELQGEPTLLMHGDLLCIDDHAYMEWRKKCRSAAFQAEFLAQPLEARRAIVVGLRQQSMEANSNKAEDIMDVNDGEVIRYLETHGSQRLIHGHTHRPKTHDIVANTKAAQRWVLGDWESTFVYLRADENGLQLIRETIT